MDNFRNLQSRKNQTMTDSKPTWRQFSGVVLKFAFFGLFLVFLIVQFADPIRLTTADLGRHLKNGELVLAGEYGPLKRNFYSYTQPDFPCINHHWGSGVLFFAVYRWFGGFPGLSFFYIGILILTFIIFFRLAEKFSNFSYAFFFSVIAIPIMSDRLEIRPEGISVLLIGIYLYLLYMYQQGKISFRRLLWVIIFLQILWVNVHILFFIGWVLIGIFCLDAFFARRNFQMTREFFILGIISIVATLINPAGIKGALVPMTIFKEYGYRLAENQTIFFMQNFFDHDPKYLYFEGMAVLSVVGLIVAYWRKNWRAYIGAFLILLFFGVFAFKAVRSMAMFGFVFVPLSAMLWCGFMQRFSILFQRIVNGVLFIAGLLIVLSGVFSTGSYFSPYRKLGSYVSTEPSIQRERGFWYLLNHPQVWSGLVPGVNLSADFFNRMNIQGPVFNNYDIGGFLIFRLFPHTKVFVDNRPEAYSTSFLKKTYVPMQEGDEAWQKVDEQYHFNSIFFYRHDLTPWGQNFLISRINDPQWAPVFVDNYSIIFLKRNEENRLIIRNFELPKSMFRVSAWNLSK